MDVGTGHADVGMAGMVILDIVCKSPNEFSSYTLTGTANDAYRN